MEKDNNNSTWTELFEEQEKELGIVFQSEKSREESLADFISQCESNSNAPQIKGGIKKAEPAVVPSGDGEEDDEKLSSSSEEIVAIPATAEKQSKKKREAAVKKECKPEYAKEKIAMLEKLTEISQAEIKRVMSDERIPTYPYGNNGLNCVIDLSAAMKNGVEILSPLVNRNHGKDQETTGDSVRTWGAQQLLLVITSEMALAANIQVSRFSNNKSKDPIDGNNALVAINGNGRLNYVYGLENAADRPQLYATFIEPDALGYYNPGKAMEVINTERSMWKTQDLVQKRILDEGDNSHQGWRLIQELVKKGYMYQSACQTVTLNTDRIKKRDVNTGLDTDIFTYFTSAKRIHEALVAKFGEGEDKTLKTKEFSREVSILWKKLLKKEGEEWATDTFLKFITSFRENKVIDIVKARSKKNGPSRDEIRKTILNEQFNQYLGKSGIEI